VESTALRQVDRARQVASEGNALAPLPGQTRYRGYETLGVGMSRIGEEILCTRLFDYSTQIHHGYLLAQVANDCHVVGDKQDR
jgi:hypothetical protein